jgi:hypothetical protein
MNSALQAAALKAVVVDGTPEHACRSGESPMAGKGHKDLELWAYWRLAKGADESARDHELDLSEFAENVVRGLIQLGCRAGKHMGHSSGNGHKHARLIHFSINPALPRESWVAVVTAAANACHVRTEPGEWKFDD